MEALSASSAIRSFSLRHLGCIQVRRECTRHSCPSSTRCVEEFGNPCQHFCPAVVYEMEEKAGTPSGIALQFDARNCVHCKACDITDLCQVINWVTPEGGGGPNYSKL